MFHHSDHYCSLVYERIQKKISRATVISAGNLFCVRARARACQKARGPEKRRKKKRIYMGLSFPLPNITTLFPSLHRSVICGAEKKANRVLRHSRCVCLNPLLCLLIKRRAGVKSHYFLHASPSPVPVHWVTLRMFALLNVSLSPAPSPRGSPCAPSSHPSPADAARKGALGRAARAHAVTRSPHR